ncbi:FmdB family zinc ribbon protein [Jonesia quinghaiensis]|uniref:FmdB family zinc ribbon protein n=1 Tax=Jonesia quinghaiensis TaxID=262806 RepID=UPI000564BAF5|nr:FmdB family zinc ribbon protein [Jonesia quinghaiensis]
MPSYAYRCKTCGHSFDIYQSFSDSALTTCPQCEGPLRKVFSTPGVTFKGSGFYRTDSASSSTSSSGTSS